MESLELKNTLGFDHLRSTFMGIYFPASMEILIFSICIKIEVLKYLFSGQFYF